METIRDTLHATFKLKDSGAVLPSGTTLVDVFEKGLEGLGVSVTPSASNPWATDAQPKPDSVEDSPVFQTFLANVTKKGTLRDVKRAQMSIKNAMKRFLVNSNPAWTARRKTQRNLKKEADEKKKLETLVCKWGTMKVLAQTTKRQLNCAQKANPAMSTTQT